jgi:tight adherence protein B
MGIGNQRSERVTGDPRLTLDRSALEESLEGAVLIIASGLKGGLSLSQSVAIAARECPGPLNALWRHIEREIAVGVPVVEALVRVEDKVGHPDYTYLARALEVHRDCGGDLTTVLEVAASTLRQRRLMRGDLRAKSAEARLTANLLTVLPPALCMYLWLAQRDIFGTLLETPLGQAGLAYAAVSWSLGIWLKRKLLRDPSEEG